MYSFSPAVSLDSLIKLNYAIIRPKGKFMQVSREKWKV